MSRSAARSDRATPAAEGFRMPAEWARHRATWLIWPHNRADFEVKTAAVAWVYAEIVRLLTDGERVAILFPDAATERRACARLAQGGVDLTRVERYRVATDRSWIRDVGPIFVTRDRRDPGASAAVALTDWGFNGWARYRAYARDNAVPGRIARLRRVRRFEATVNDGRRRSVVLEGGAIDVNGQGLLLTTEECLLSPIQARNPGLDRRSIEGVLREFLGIRRVLWLSAGIAGDDTHGHVDDVARFVAPDVVAAATEADVNDINHAPLRENLARLAIMRDTRDRRLTVVPIPMPRPVYFEGDRLPASYLNFYIANRCVLVPTFNDPADRIALARLGELFPDREVVGVHARDLVLGLGTLHCLTQQEPSGA